MSASSKILRLAILVLLVGSAFAQPGKPPARQPETLRKIERDTVEATKWFRFMRSPAAGYYLKSVDTRGNAVWSVITSAAYADSAGGARRADSLVGFNRYAYQLWSDTNTYDLTRYRAGLLYEPIITAPNTAGKYWTGFKTFATLRTDSITEGANLWYTDARARASVSAVAPISYNSSTGKFSLDSSITSGTYTNATVTVDKFGRVTSASSGTGFADDSTWSMITVGTGSHYVTMDSTGITMHDPELFGDSFFLKPGIGDGGNYGKIILYYGWQSHDANSYATTFAHTTSLTANRIVNIPNAAGTMAVSASGYLALSAAGDITLTDGELTGIGGLTSAADRLPYYTGSGTAALATFTSQARNLVDDATAAAMATTIGVGTGDSPQFTGATLSGMTAGNVAYYGTSGVFSGNTSYTWDNTTKQLYVNSGASPTTSQQVWRANAAGGFSILSYAADNIQNGFDVDYASSGWVARHGGVAWFYKTGGYLYTAGSTGNTIGAAATQNLLTRLDLNTGEFSTVRGGLRAYPSTLGNTTLTLESPATNDDPVAVHNQNRVTTTDATVTTLHTFTLTASKTTMIKVWVTARRTGGSSGTAEDGAGYEIIGTYKVSSGTATLIGSVTTLYSAESNSAWDCTLTASGGTVLVRVTGAANNNITWHMSDSQVMQVGT